MFNAAQIKKIQTKIGKKVDVQIKKREEKDRINRNNNLNEIRVNINQIEQEYPNRGSCICIWDKYIYKYNPKLKKVIACPELSNNITSDIFENVTPISEKRSGKSYYLMHKHAFDFNNRFMEFFSKNYAYIKMAVHKKELKDMLMLGTIFENFQKEFPEYTPLDFKRGVDMIDSLLKGAFL
jgi:hypothetical protein